MWKSGQFLRYYEQEGLRRTSRVPLVCVTECVLSLIIVIYRIMSGNLKGFKDINKTLSEQEGVGYIPGNSHHCQCICLIIKNINYMESLIVSEIVTIS